MRASRNIEHEIPAFKLRSKVWNSVRNYIARSGPALVGVAASIFITSILVAGQSAEKTVSFQPSRTFLASQISISEVRVGEDVRRVTSTKVGDASLIAPIDFKAEADWLNRLSFQMENISGKPIVYLSIRVWFPETTATGNVMVYPLSFGQRPGSTFHTSNPPFLMKPTEKVDVSLAPKYGDISRFVGQRHAIETINKIELEVSFIVFEDGTAWNVGQFMRQDPNDPNRYIPIQTDPPGN